MKKSKVLIGLVLLMSALGLAAQEQIVIQQDEQAEQIFAEGVIFYRNRDYAAANEQFARLIEPGRGHQRLSAALIMHARTSYLLRDYKAVEQDLRRLIRYFPESRYIPHARYLMALVHFQRADYFQSARQFLWLVDFSDDDRIAAESLTSARVLLDEYLSLDDVKKLQRDTAGKNGLALVVLAEARKLMQEREAGAAAELISEFLEKNAGSTLEKELRAALDRTKEALREVTRIGVILPLTGAYATEGKAMLDGLRYAEDEFKRNNPSGPAFEFVVRDSESRIIKALQEMQALVADPRVICVVGEFENFITAALAGLADAHDLPLLAPVATDVGIAGLGSSVFQLSPDLETQARALARYAVDSLQLKTFVTIAPQDEYGRQMVDAFSAEIDSRTRTDSTSIVTQRWYYGVPENIGRQFKEIREIAFKKVMEDTLRERHPEFVGLDRDSLWTALNEAIMLENNTREGIVELNSHFPVTNIDGVFMPIYAEDVRYLARQLTYFNLKTQILGGEYWYLNNLDKLRELQRYVDGTIFVSSYYYDPTSLAYIAFRDAYRKARGRTPERWELTGYDAARAVLHTLEKGAASRKQVREILAGGEKIKGRANLIHLDPRTRTNTEVNILKIDRTVIRKVDTPDGG
ncbi:MAG TPA: outer membrane protein assembly factor BamD [Bacteroidetes bacterium]|nr:outer membrane protein assembly factor BamD [Bacteroidota bacterium]